MTRFWCFRSVGIGSESYKRVLLREIILLRLRPHVMQSDCSENRPFPSKLQSIIFTVHSHAQHFLNPQQMTRDSSISRLWVLTKSSTRFGQRIAQRISKTVLRW